MIKQDREMNAAERFKSDTAGHTMEILHDDGVYRHVRFRNEQDWNCWYELTTWPEHLSISGDMGTYVFARTEDMFRFFRGRDTINPYYWSEKLVAPRGRDGARSWSKDSYVASVRDWLRDECEELSAEDAQALRVEVQDRLLDWADELDIATAYERVSNFCWEDSTGERHQPYDVGEWNFADYDWHFLWCCWAIMMGIKQYDEARVDA